MLFVLRNEEFSDFFNCHSIIDRIEIFYSIELNGKCHMKKNQICSSGLGMLIKTQITNSVSFLKPILKIGKQKTVEYTDLGKPNKYLNPTELNNKFEVEWKKEKEKEPKKQSLLNACIQSTKPSLWIWSIVFYVTGLVINFFPSIVLKQLLLDLENNSMSFYSMIF